MQAMICSPVASVGSCPALDRYSILVEVSGQWWRPVIQRRQGRGEVFRQQVAGNEVIDPRASRSMSKPVSHNKDGESNPTFARLDLQEAGAGDR